MGGNKKVFYLDVKNVKIKGLDGNPVQDFDASGKPVDVEFKGYKDFANLVYRNVTDIDFVAPLQQLSKDGAAEFDLDQLAAIEAIVKQSYTLPFQLAICERIEHARNAKMEE